VERKPSMLNDDELARIKGLLGGNFEVLDQIGKGGQKLAYHIKTDSKKDFVLKIVFVTSDSVERVKREIRAVIVIDHPNVPKVLFTNCNDSTISDNVVWIIEEFISGSNLRQVLATGKRFNLAEVIVFMNTIFSILLKSEENHIVHRDIKPENIMLSSEDVFYLIDFGISRHLDLESLTASNAPFGPCTIGYASSEQLRNMKKDIDIRADLFSLAVVITEMITGVNPYIKDSQNVMQIMKKIDLVPLPAIQIVGDSQYLLSRFLKAMGDNRPSRRPSSVNEAIEIFELIKPTLKY
jgi:serine/threonine-protein kinase